jgi:hypothetical protein
MILEIRCDAFFEVGGYGDIGAAVELGEFAGDDLLSLAAMSEQAVGAFKFVFGGDDFADAVRRACARRNRRAGVRSWR